MDSQKATHPAYHWQPRRSIHLALQRDRDQNEKPDGTADEKIDASSFDSPSSFRVRADIYPSNPSATGKSRIMAENFLIPSHVLIRQKRKREGN